MLRSLDRLVRSGDGVNNPIRFTDLSQPLYHGCPGWPEYEPMTLRRDFMTGYQGFNAETVKMNTHTGTHVDAPFHFFDEGATIEQLPLEAFAGEAVFIDLRGIEADTPIGRAELEPYASTLKEGDIAILTTGWSGKRDHTKEFLTAWPYLDADGAQLLVDAGVKGVGIDTISVGGWGSPEKGRPCHEVILGAGKFIVEELKVPESLLGGGRYFFSAFPILLSGCGGAWARAVVYDFG